MTSKDWTRQEVEAIVDDYLSMLASELTGTIYSKAAHRRALRSRLTDRSDQSIEFKHANISAILLEAGFPYIAGYKPRSNYQKLLAEVVARRMAGATQLQEIAYADADRLIVVPEVDDILRIVTSPPSPLAASSSQTVESTFNPVRLTTNYIEREARNRSLGNAGERFVVNYERARLILAGKEPLAARIEHTSQVRGDYEGYDILSFEESGRERLIEVKTTKYGSETPFFVSKNEVSTSELHASVYYLYRLYAFRTSPKLYTLAGAISERCYLSPTTFLAKPR